MSTYTVSRYNPARKEMAHLLNLSADSPRDAAEIAMRCKARRRSNLPYHPDHDIPLGENVMVEYRTDSGRKLCLPFVASEGAPRFVESLA